MKLQFSIIIPVYNRPKEIEELLESMASQTYKKDFEIIIVEDSSDDKCDAIIEKYQKKLNITYFFREENKGAGQCRNYGMLHAKGNYFIILDSDVLLPIHYLEAVEAALILDFTDAFGGADASHISFTALQKAISYSMTSVLTTGGIRGKKKSIGKFQPRSFNFGVSKNAFEKTKGFSKMKYGEDIDLTFRLWENDFETQFIEGAFVYHKRRSTIKDFYKQTFNFGTARPILNQKHPKTTKLTYWFPSLFVIGVNIALIFGIFFGKWFLALLFMIYFTVIFSDSLLKNKNLKVAFLSIITAYTQFLGYGVGFFKSMFKL